MKILFLIGIAVTVFITGACTDTFLVGKYENNFFLGNMSDAMYAMLCASGDLEKVLLSSHLSPEMKDALCTV